MIEKGRPRTQVKLICKMCNVEFYEFYCKKDRSKFCSATCRKAIVSCEQKQFEELIKRFDRDVIKQDGCWDWNACANEFGYGKMSYRGKQLKAHRVSWMIHKGPIPKNKDVCHSCDNPRCSNPNHLFLGTHSANMKDAVLKKRLNMKQRKLDEKKVIEIKKMIRRKLSDKTIAEQYGVHPATIWSIRTKRNWSHISEKR